MNLFEYLFILLVYSSLLLISGHTDDKDDLTKYIGGILLLSVLLVFIIDMFGGCILSDENYKSINNKLTHFCCFMTSFTYVSITILHFWFNECWGNSWVYLFHSVVIPLTWMN